MLMGIYQLCRVIGEAGVELSSGEHFLMLRPLRGFLELDRAPLEQFGLPVKHFWDVVPRALIH